MWGYTEFFLPSENSYQRGKIWIQAGANWHIWMHQIPASAPYRRNWWDKTVEEKRQRLESIYSQDGIHGGERAEVTDLMKTTFSLQRRHIHEIPVPSVADLQMMWPYLFKQKGIFSHFELLTDLPVLRALELAIEECGNGIVEYFRTKVKSKDVQAVLSQR